MNNPDKTVVARAVIASGNKILLLVRADHDDVRPGEYDLPGGGIEPNDASVKDGMIREIKEETGLTVNAEDITEIHVASANTDSNIERHVFYCKVRDMDNIRVDANEHSSYEWVDIIRVGDIYKRPVYSAAIQKLAERNIL